MKRAFFGCLWWVVLFFGTGVAVAVTVAFAAPDDPKAAGRAGEQWGGLICLGTFALVLGLTLMGLLPGTAKRKRPEPPPEPVWPSAPAPVAATVELSHFNPAHPSAWSAPAPPPSPQKTSPIVIEGSSEHTFTFSGFMDRWLRVGPAIPIFGLIGMFIMSGAMKSGHTSVLLVGGGMLAIGLAVLLFLIYRLFTVLEAKLSAGGITWSGVFWPRTRAWDQIANVYRAETVTNRRWRVRDLRIEFVGGGSVTFDQSLTDFDSLADQVQRVVGDMMLPRKRADLAQGKAEFGPVTLTLDGIEMRHGYVRKYFSWSDLGRHAILNGHLVLQGRPGYRPQAGIGASILNALFVDLQRYGKMEGDIAVPLSEVPNYVVLLTLMEQCGAMRR